MDRGCWMVQWRGFCFASACLSSSINGSFAHSLNETGMQAGSSRWGRVWRSRGENALCSGAYSGARQQTDRQLRNGRSVLQATAKKAPLGEGLRQAGGGGRERGGRDKRQATSDK